VTQSEVCVGRLDTLLDRLADDFRAEAERATARRGFFAVALPGGSVAVHGFSALAALPLHWDRVHFFWVDERAVPPSDPESNYGVAHTAWLEPARVPPQSIHRMSADSPDLASAAVAYGQELTRVLGHPARLDFVLLGVGPDGHVASLFPGHSALSDDRRMVVPVVAMQESIERPDSSLPVALVLQRAERSLVLVDEAAASRMGRRRC
jgi:6-phosphogluconolactonase